MAVILDTGIVYATYDRRDSWHRRAVDLIKAEAGALIIPAPVIPEVDYLLGRIGDGARHMFYQGISDDSYFVADLPRERYGRVFELDKQFSDLELGFVDAAVIVIAESLGLMRIATTDRRDFDVVAGLLGIEIVP